MKISTSTVVVFVLCIVLSQVLANEPVTRKTATLDIPDPVDVIVPVPSGNERIFLQTPAGQPAKRPMILIFHGAYYDEHWDNPHDSLQKELRALLSEAAQRGWYAVSLNGGEAKLVGTYAGPELHQRTTAVIDYLQDRYRIDCSRIYTLGYSMGGIDAVNYAARHLDPERAIIAAVWCWSGALCAEVSEVPCKIVPCNPLARIAASTVQTTCGEQGAPTGEFVANESLAWNLEHLSITTAQATRDIAHVTCPALALRKLTAQWKDPSRHTHLSNYGKTHNDASAWNPKEICDFFDGKSATLPTFATRTIVVEDRKYFYFDVARTDTSRTGVFGWNFEGQQLSMDAVENVAELKLSVDGGVDSPLTSAGDLKIHLNSADRQKTRIVLQHHTAGRPISVSRNGIAYSHEAVDVWTWDSRTQTVTLSGLAGAEETTWVIRAP